MFTKSTQTKTLEFHTKKPNIQTKKHRHYGLWKTSALRPLSNWTPPIKRDHKVFFIQSNQVKPFPGYSKQISHQQFLYISYSLSTIHCLVNSPIPNLRAPIPNLGLLTWPSPQISVSQCVPLLSKVYDKC